MASANSALPHVCLDNANVAHDENMAGLELNESAIETERDASDMLQRCRLLLDELEPYQLYLKQQKKENSVEKLHTFKSHVQNEMKLLDKVGAIVLLLDTC